jgi:2,4-dienoyl-CoA reductase-like NADH-dependent reductase (Old Yellow Enzyme family)/thioredoxin reductase
MFASDSRDNLPGDTLAYYCAERAKGGVALIEISMAIVATEVGQTAPSVDSHFDPLNQGHPMILTGRWPLRGTDPRIVEGYSKIAKMVHEHGAKCFVELASGGANVGNEKGVSRFPWPSHPLQVFPFTPRELTEEDIEAQIEAYGYAAKLVKDSGLDGVDLHGTHGSLICEFLSPLLNKRKDKWGGTLENRMRFLKEVIKRVREYVGNEIAVGMRLMGDERFEGGNTPQDAAEIARRLDGELDWITADQGYSPQQEDWQAVPMYVESGYNLRITNPIKAVLTKTKVGVVGKYVDPLFAETLIASGQADIVAMTRALIADPELPNKAFQGKLEEIRPCIGVLQGCWGRMIRGLPISCTVNPAVGRERVWGIGTLKRAERRRKVLIIGAGVAGLECARVCAERGHEVVVYEKAKEAGGQALLAAKIPGRSNIKAIVEWLLHMAKQNGVTIRYGLEVTNEEEVIEYLIKEEKPDVVVVATGSYPIRNGFQPYTMNEVVGWNEGIVSTDQDVWEGKVDVGDKLIIADTLSFIEAPGLAEYLAKKGKSVEIVTPLANIALELKLYNHWEHLLPRVFALGVDVTPFTWIKKVEKRSVTLYNVYLPQRTWSKEVDNVILITGRLQNDSLYNVFKEKIKETYLIGDARIAGARIDNAIYDANKLAREL